MGPSTREIELFRQYKPTIQLLVSQFAEIFAQNVTEN